jgi:hypothetical protein
MGEMNVYNILVGKTEGNRPLGRPGPRWYDTITMDLREMGWERVGWLHLAQWWTLVGMVLNLRFIKGGEFLD